MPTYFYSTPACRFYTSASLAERYENDSHLSVMCTDKMVSHYVERYLSPIFTHPKTQVVIRIHIFRNGDECFSRIVDAVSIVVMQVGLPMPYFLVGVCIREEGVYHVVMSSTRRIIGMFGHGRLRVDVLRDIGMRCDERIEDVRRVLTSIVDGNGNGLYSNG